MAVPEAFGRDDEAYATKLLERGASWWRRAGLSGRAARAPCGSRSCRGSEECRRAIRAWEELV